MATYKGFAYIPDPLSRIGHVVPATDRALIESGIRQILETVPGERVMRPTFGSRQKYLVFEPLDEVIKNQLKRENAEAILREENRIIIDDITVEPDDSIQHQVNVRIKYRFKDDIHNLKEMVLVLELS